MGIRKNAGSTLYIGAIMDPGTEDLIAADFPAVGDVSWVSIARLEDLGELGDASDPITFDDLALNRRLKLKGTRDAGTMDIVLGADPEETGHQALIAAEKTPNDYAFQVVWNDAIGTGGTPTRRLFVAQVSNVRERYGTANNIIRMNVSLLVNSNVVRVLRVAGT